ncbi:MAG: hypothetical protein AAFR35_15385 [Pseudomonadota bacterium]
MNPLTALAAVAILLAPAELSASGAGPADQPVMEIVTFRLRDGVDTGTYLDAARATEAFLRETGAVTRRALTRDADGTWTDIIEWTSLRAAKAAEAEAMGRPEFAAFFDAFDPESLQMRHAPILWRME